MILTTFQPDFIPVLRELNENIVTTHAQFTRMLHDLGLRVKTLNEFATPQMYELSRNIAAFGLLDYYQYEFIKPFEDERNTWLINNLPGYFYGKLGDIAFLLLCLTASKPDLIMVHNDVEPFNRLLALWAKQNNVPCLHVPHAIYLEHGGRGAVGSDVHDLISASHIACSGPYQAEWYATRGAQNIYMTGLPKTDALANFKKEKSVAAQMLGCSSNRPVVTYCSSWRQDTNLLGCHDGIEECYTAFLQAAKELPELQYIVKCHPRGNNLEWHKQLAKDAGVRCIVLENHIETVLAASDVLISYGASNVVLEAAWQPYVRIAIVGDTAALPNDPEIYKITDLELAKHIKTLLMQDTPNYNRLLQKYFVALDNLNYKRVASLARSLHDAHSNAGYKQS